jgi:hypothetical protein
MTNEDLKVINEIAYFFLAGSIVMFVFLIVRLFLLFSVYLDRTWLLCTTPSVKDDVEIDNDSSRN